MRSVRIGCGSANATERPDLFLDMVENGDVTYLCFDNLAERTLAEAQLEKLRDPTRGYNPLLGDRMRLGLKPAIERGIKIVGNMGAANPISGGALVLDIARELGIDDITVSVVTGDDIRDRVLAGQFELEFWETGGGLDSLPGEVVSANVYIGADPMIAALGDGADVVVAGRCSDLSPYVACLVHEFGWKTDEWEVLAGAAAVGHFLECGRYVTGGAYADPAAGKLVPRMEDLALPLATVNENGTAVIGKVAGSGGIMTVDTCKEQICHEIHDPTTYLSPDVILDVSNLELTQVGEEEVAVSGARGRAKPEMLKLLVGVRDGSIAEGEISFAGRGAVQKARMCIDTFRTRIERSGINLDVRADIIGVNSVFGSSSAVADAEPVDVRLRLSACVHSDAQQELFVAETENMWFGPIGGGGVRSSIRPVLAMYSSLVHRDAVPLEVTTTHQQTRRF